METVRDCIFLGSKITADGNCNRETKRHFIFRSKAMTNLDSILKSRDITLPTKVHIEVMLFPVVMHGWKSWTRKKAKHWRTDAFELRCCRRHLWTFLDCKEIQPVHPKGNSGLNIHWKEWCWIWSSNSLATWCEELTHWKRLWCWERLRAGGEGENREWDGWMASPTRWTWVWVNSRSWWWTVEPGVLQSVGSQRAGHSLVTEWQDTKESAECP